MVNLVHSSVCVKWMLLAGFKSVESDEICSDLKIVDLLYLSLE